MTYAAEESAIRAHLVANWSTTPIQWPNVQYDPIPGTSYVRYTLTHGVAFQSSLGANARERTPGVVLLEVWVPEGNGLLTVASYVDTLAGVFRQQTISNLVFGSPTGRPAADTTAPGWYRWIVEAPFYRDDNI